MTPRIGRLGRVLHCVLLGLAILLTLGGTTALAAEDVHGAEAEVAAAADTGNSKGLLAIGAGLALGLAALATGMAQAKIGAAGVGAVAEDPKRIGVVIMLLAIPETVAILGFVIAYLIIT